MKRRLATNSKKYLFGMKYRRPMVLGSTNPISKEEIYTELSGDVGISTIEVVLGDMVREGVVEKRGVGAIRGMLRDRSSGK
jgi:hypothetical protein